MKRISVITISYNQGRFLEQTLRSVIHQSQSPYELIVVDGGSTDETPTILEKFGASIDRLIVGADTGPANALNLGVAESSGDVIVCVNAGDGLLRDALSTAQRHLDGLQGPFVMYGNGIAIDEEDRPLRPFLSTRLSARRYVTGGAVILHQATYFERNALLRVGGFNEENRVTWDGELIARAAHAGVPVIRVPEPLGAIRIHTGAISSAGSASGEVLLGRRKLFAEIMGREPRRSDALLRRYYRLEKHLTNPGYTLRRGMATTGAIRLEAWPWWTGLPGALELSEPTARRNDSPAVGRVGP